MLGHCGLVNPKNPCRCSKRVRIAKKLGRVNAENLIFSTTQQRVGQFPEVLNEIRMLEQHRRAAALFQSQLSSNQKFQSNTQFNHWLSDLINTNKLQHS